MGDTRTRLEELHRGRTTPPERFAALVREATGQEPLRAERIVEGEVNEVVAAELEDGSSVVVRIDHLGIGFAHELWAMDAVRAVGVPVARVVGSDARAERVVVLERLPGRTLLALLLAERPGDARRRRLVERAGELLARVHSIETEGHGPIRGRAGRGAFETVGAWLDEELARERLEEAFARTALEPRLLDAALAEVARADGMLAAPRLVHRDFGPKHLFVDGDDRLVALIDFGRVESADPALDLGGWRFWFEDTLPLAWLLAGYARAGELGPRLDERLRLAELLELLHLLRHYAVVQPFPRAAAETAARLRTLLG